MTTTTAANVEFKRPNGEWITLLNLVWPVGSVYMSHNSTSPSSCLGGIWTTMTGRFPYFNSSVSTGGSNAIVSHFHALDNNGGAAIDFGLGGSSYAMYLQRSSSVSTLTFSSLGLTPDCRAIYDATGGNLSAQTSSVLTRLGGRSGTISNATPNSNKQFGNMPAYQSLYGWYRTS